jgi:hypothetical protein
VPRRKAAVVAAMRAGVISREEACERYALSPEEFAAWEAAFDQHGLFGLRITRLQYYRDVSNRRRRLRPMGNRKSARPDTSGFQ